MKKKKSEAQSLFPKTMGSDSIKSEQTVKGPPSHPFKSGKCPHPLNHSPPAHLGWERPQAEGLKSEPEDREDIGWLPGKADRGTEAGLHGSAKENTGCRVKFGISSKQQTMF